MRHLTEDQIYHLAQVTRNYETLTAEEEQQMEHIRLCKECLKSYCIMAVLWEATRVDCALTLNPVHIVEKMVNPARKLLAVIRVTYKQIQDKISLIGTQVDDKKHTFMFEPVLATAVRGVEKRRTNVLRMEELEDENTYIVYDAESHKLMIQFDAGGKNVEEFLAYLKFADEMRMHISLRKNGSYLKGSLTNIPTESFEIYIEEKKID